MSSSGNPLVNIATNMIGLTDGIDVDDVLASVGSGASRPVASARHGQFALGDHVKHTLYRHFLAAKVIGFTPKQVRVAFTNVWGREDEAFYSARSLVHVEPTASLEATLSGEANL